MYDNPEAIKNEIGYINGDVKGFYPDVCQKCVKAIHQIVESRKPENQK